MGQRDLAQLGDLTADQTGVRDGVIKARKGRLWIKGTSWGAGLLPNRGGVCIQGFLDARARKDCYSLPNTGNYGSNKMDM